MDLANDLIRIQVDNDLLYTKYSDNHLPPNTQHELVNTLGHRGYCQSQMPGMRKLPEGFSQV